MPVATIREARQANAYARFRVRLSSGEVHASVKDETEPPIGSVAGGPIRHDDIRYGRTPPDRVQSPASDDTRHGPVRPPLADDQPQRLPWEREALDFVRESLPDRTPYRAWSNFEFVAQDGSINEVDLLPGRRPLPPQGHPAGVAGRAPHRHRESTGAREVLAS